MLYMKKIAYFNENTLENLSQTVHFFDFFNIGIYNCMGFQVVNFLDLIVEDGRDFFYI